MFPSEEFILATFRDRRCGFQRAELAGLTLPEAAAAEVTPGARRLGLWRRPRNAATEPGSAMGGAVQQGG